MKFVKHKISRKGVILNILMRSLILVAFISVILMPKTNALAAIGSSYYVSPSGIDSNPGTLSKPWKTIRKASTVTAGDTVFIREGTYNESVTFATSGSSSNPISIMAFPGENPIVDGTFTMPGVGGFLFSIRGNYITVSGIEFRNSAYGGIYVSGNYDLIDNVYVHHCEYNGIFVSLGHDSTVENSRIWRTSLSNEYEQGNGWSSALSAARLGVTYTTLRNNTIWENWGEGISSYEADHITIEGNIAHDNSSSNIYISDSTNILIQGNFVYMDRNSYVYGYGSNVGIMMGDEKYTPPSANIQVINNIAYSNHRNFYWWQGTQGGGMNNVLIANNTFVNGTGVSSNNEGGVIIGKGSHTNVRFENNLVSQDDSLAVISTIAQPGVYYSNNLWSKAPISAANGSGDVIGDPKLVKVGSYYLADWFRLGDTSPAIDKGQVLSEVSIDYFRNSRGSSPDIGADEFINGSSGQVTLTINKAGTGTGTVTSSPGGINCGSTCSYTFGYNVPVTLTAAPTSRSAFGSWNGGGCSGTGTCIVILTASTSVIANFTRKVRDDYDGDGKTDPTKFISSAGSVWWLKSTTGLWDGKWLGSDTFTYVGASDFDGDGKTDPAKFYPTTGTIWWIKSSAGTTDGEWLGSDTFTYITGSDFDGDGRSDPAKFYPATGTVWWVKSSTGILDGQWLGGDAFQYVSGSDFDGDGKTDPAKFYPATGTVWWVKSTTGTIDGMWMGSDTFTYVPASDFDGDGRTDPAKFYPATGTVWWVKSSTGALDGAWLGPGTFTYVAGCDFDGDGKTDPTKYVASTHTLSWLKLGTGSWTNIDLGTGTYTLALGQ